MSHREYPSIERTWKRHGHAGRRGSAPRTRALSGEPPRAPHTARRGALPGAPPARSRFAARGSCRARERQRNVVRAARAGPRDQRLARSTRRHCACLAARPARARVPVHACGNVGAKCRWTVAPAGPCAIDRCGARRARARTRRRLRAAIRRSVMQPRVRRGLRRYQRRTGRARQCRSTSVPRSDAPDAVSRLGGSRSYGAPELSDQRRTARR